MIRGVEQRHRYQGRQVTPELAKFGYSLVQESTDVSAARAQFDQRMTELTSRSGAELMYIGSSDRSFNRVSLPPQANLPRLPNLLEDASLSLPRRQERARFKSLVAEWVRTSRIIRIYLAGTVLQQNEDLYLSHPLKDIHPQTNSDLIDWTDL